MTSTSHRFLAFGVVGVMATLFHYAVMFAGHTLWPAPVLWALAGATTGAVVGYVLNYTCTFRSPLRHRHTMPRYFVIAGLSILANTSLIWLLVKQAGIALLPAQIASTGAIFVFSFIAHSRLTFYQRSL